MTPNNTYKEYDYPLNLLLDLRMGQNTPSHATVVSNEYLDTLEQVMSTLPDHERTAILSRYRLQMTYDEIGKLLNLSGARAGQLVAKGLRLLRHPARSKYLRRPKETPPPAEELPFTIPSMPLSLKAANLLMRGNMQTTSDILEKSPEELAQIPGMGKTLYTEIIDFLEYEGCEVSAYRTYSAAFDKNKYNMDKHKSRG